MNFKLLIFSLLAVPLLLSGCNSNKPLDVKVFKVEEVKPAITDELIGAATVSEMKALFKCDYILDFTPSGNQLWAIKVGKERLKLIFDDRDILARIEYPKSFKHTVYEIDDDGTYYIPKEVYIPEEPINETIEMDIESGGVEIAPEGMGPKDILKKPE